MEKSYKNSEVVIQAKPFPLECGGFAFLRNKAPILKDAIHALGFCLLFSHE
jgi:hypothetical protein